MAKGKPNEINLIRIYNAPVKVVWDAWTDPKKAAKWWGPRGFTITTHSKDLRPGGTWNYTMHGPDGVDYENITLYHEVEKYSRLVYDHGANKTQPPLFRVTVLFSEENGMTTMDMTMSLATEEAAKQIKGFIKAAGGNATWDRLAEYLEKEENGQNIFVINRAFEAPIEVMFDMFTNPEHFSKWLPPTGMTMTYLKSNIKEGETTLYSMSDGAGFTLYNRAKYLKISKPHTIVFTQEFCDEKGNLQKAPWDANWPAMMVTTVQLTKESATETRVTITTSLPDSTTPIEIESFLKERDGMTKGWTGSLDKLEELIKK